MAEVIVTFKIMPSSVDDDLTAIEKQAVEQLAKHGRVEGVEQQPLAFGLKSLILYAVFDEQIGNKVDDFADELKSIDGVETCEVEDVRRAIDLD
ncbi:elongation factor 1-beta [archaeon CG10_big_fil_rev_8_21_14_0_10_43_11]|nr:MAG: elongation factor 1-beta [archaeon CG10_big_fil_rev_8_21_14_0_10_43_11]